MSKFKRLIAALMAMILCLSLVMLVACKPKKPDEPDNPDDPTKPSQTYNPETRPLTMSIQNPDGVFNPFFSTSAMDSTIIGMTQVSMLTSTKDGEPKWGDDEPVVVKDCKIEEVEVSGNKYTDYSFIIKNGIKFSDGEPLTIKDVLFNLYIYLDPVYTGSSTIYSTDIVGLQAYRLQIPDADNKDAAAAEERYISAARIRRSNLIKFVQAFGVFEDNPSQGIYKPSKSDFTQAQIKSFQEDVAYVAKEFRKELESDWNNASVESYEDEGFTEKWQVFLYQDAQENFYKKDSDGRYIKDDKGNRQVDPTLIAAKEAELDEWLEEFKLAKNDENIRLWAIDTAFMPYFELAVLANPYDESAFDADHIAATIARIDANQFSLIVNAWATADTVITKFVADAKSSELGTGAHPIKTISGITSSAAELEKVSVDFKGNNLGEPHDVLKIRINDVDPKAIWNFSFNVAPMHYYSNATYVAAFNAAEGNFGFKYGDTDFFNDVLNAPSKVGLPLGAGVYMASTVNGGAASNGGQFNNNNIIYYERNPYFETLGPEISNAKIKYFRYKVVETDQITNAITNGDIDIGDPNATPEKRDELVAKGISVSLIKTSGYGYVGINPRFVPSVSVRRAIMKAMDRSIIYNEYYKSLCEIINRPMSTTNWAYPKGAAVYSTTYLDKDENEKKVSYEFDGIGEDIERLVASDGYVMGKDGVFSKVLKDGSTHRLSYKFTIAGSSVDHPAYSMFLTAQKILNAHGFDIKVVTSQSALSDLSAGKLAVWAAAWSSTIDPDMYQVYHKDSNATSVNNWGYPQIKANTTLYKFEYGIVNDLSKLIDAGRETTDQDERAGIYADALDLVMELAVEMPTYQRYDMTAYNGKILDRSTMTPEAELTPYNGLLARIWELNYN